MIPFYKGFLKTNSSGTEGIEIIMPKTEPAPALLLNDINKTLGKVNDTLYEYRLAPNSIWPSLLARVVVALVAGTIAAAVNAIFLWLFTGINLADFVPDITAPLVVIGLTYICFTVAVTLLIESFSGATMLTVIAAVLKPTSPNKRQGRLIKYSQKLNYRGFLGSCRPTIRNYQIVLLSAGRAGIEFIAA